MDLQKQRWDFLGFLHFYLSLEGVEVPHQIEWRPALLPAEFLWERGRGREVGLERTCKSTGRRVASFMRAVDRASRGGEEELTAAAVARPPELNLRQGTHLRSRTCSGKKNKRDEGNEILGEIGRGTRKGRKPVASRHHVAPLHLHMPPLRKQLQAQVARPLPLQPRPTVTVDCTGEMSGGGEEDGEVLVDVFMSTPPTSTSFSAGDGGGVVAWDAGAWRCSC
jgi:hypothetical protein